MKLAYLLSVGGREPWRADGDLVPLSVVSDF